MKTHQYHILEPSKWPIISAFVAMFTFFGAVFFMHKIEIGTYLLPAGIIGMLVGMFFWWKDVVFEAKVDKAHTAPVRHGLRMGMALFILSEVMFFFAFFFSFFHSSFFPPDILTGDWPSAEGIWPPNGIKTIDPWNLPFINTLILLLSGTTVTWAHYAVIKKDNKSLTKALGTTVLLGILFSIMQAYEYHHALNHNFDFTSTAYGANFYLATGFHGFHVILGTAFLAVCYFRAKKNQFSPKHHLGFEFAAWYWHFVDVVWLFLFSVVYIWGA